MRSFIDFPIQGLPCRYDVSNVTGHLWVLMGAWGWGAAFSGAQPKRYFSPLFPQSDRVESDE